MKEHALWMQKLSGHLQVGSISRETNSLKQLDCKFKNDPVLSLMFTDKAGEHQMWKSCLQAAALTNCPVWTITPNTHHAQFSSSLTVSPRALGNRYSNCILAKLPLMHIYHLCYNDTFYHALSHHTFIFPVCDFVFGLVLGQAKTCCNFPMINENRTVGETSGSYDLENQMGLCVKMR